MVLVLFILPLFAASAAARVKTVIAVTKGSAAEPIVRELQEWIRIQSLKKKSGFAHPSLFILSEDRIPILQKQFKTSIPFIRLEYSGRLITFASGAVLSMSNSKALLEKFQQAAFRIKDHPLLRFLKQASSWIWGLPLIILLLGTGLYLTVRLRFIQFRGLRKALHLAFVVRSEKDGEGDINHFQALMTALAATVGTGNIVGVAGAVSIGGPGALFWMWMTGFLGMATKYAEAVLAVKYREKDDKDEMCGGPMYYLSRGLKQHWLGVLFAIFAAIAAFGIGNMVQSNSIAAAANSSFGISPGVIGAILMVLTGLVIIGGIKEIGKVTAVLVPFMIVAYVLGGLIILLLNAGKVPGAFALVFKGAFAPLAAAGGVAGFTVMKAINKGVSRGIFSNESGMGSAPIAAAAAKTKSPTTQALVSMTQTFIDTIIVCTITGLVIIISGLWKDQSLKGLLLTNKAFSWGFSGGDIIVSFGIIFFAFSTILGWFYYGERSVLFLMGRKAILPYKTLWVGAVLLGAILKLDLVWTFSDVMNGLMVFPNLVGLIGLSGIIAHETKEYFSRPFIKEECL